MLICCHTWILPLEGRRAKSTFFLSKPYLDWRGPTENCHKSWEWEKCWKEGLAFIMPVWHPQNLKIIQIDVMNPVSIQYLKGHVLSWCCYFLRCSNISLRPFLVVVDYCQNRLCITHFTLHFCIDPKVIWSQRNNRILYWQTKLKLQFPWLFVPL